MKVEIIPALLVRSVADLEDGLARLRGVASWVQVDFVNNNYLKGEEAFPLWEEFDFEADLMLAHPQESAESMVILGAARVVIHAQNPEARAALEILQDKRSGDFAVEVGIALRSRDTADALKEFDGLYNYVQVMGIEHEGVQGEEFDASALELIKSLRSAYPGVVIQVDGGVKIDNARALAQAGANRLVAGSALAGADNPKDAYKRLYTEANGSE